MRRRPKATAFFLRQPGWLPQEAGTQGYLESGSHVYYRARFMGMGAVLRRPARRKGERPTVRYTQAGSKSISEEGLPSSHARYHGRRTWRRLRDRVPSVRGERPKARNHCRGEASVRRCPRSVGFSAESPNTGSLGFRESLLGSWVNRGKSPLQGVAALCPRLTRRALAPSLRSRYRGPTHPSVAL